MKDLLKREMFRILRVLFHNDIDPILLSFYPGDTPIHAAVCIGLKFEHGELYFIFLISFFFKKRELYFLSVYGLF